MGYIYAYTVLVAKNSSIGSNKSYSNRCQLEGRNMHELECLQKNTSFNVNDICLNANLLSSCSPSETLAAGSNSGSVGVRTGHSLTNDSFNQNILIIVIAVHRLLIHQHRLHPINWMPNAGAFNIIGISSSGGGRCFEDRHSTSAESDNDINNNSMKLINNGLENGRSWRNDMNCANSYDLNGESMNTNINASHEMTLSYLASNAQNPINCHASYCQQQQQLKNMGNQSPFKSPSVINPPHIQMTCCTNTNTNNPHSNFNRSRDNRNNQLTKMIGDHVCTGSGSLTDEVTASSPGSSATGRTQSYLNHISSSPTNTSLNFKKYNRIIGKYEDEDDNDELNINRDINFRNFGNKHDGLGIRQNISPLPPRKYSSNKNQLATDTQVSERFQNLGTGIPIRNNALSSDYASQQSSLSNKSSGSSATNHGFSPEKHANYTNKVRIIDVNTNTHTVGASFVLDRVPTPEPQHRTGPFARLLQYNLSDQPINRLQIQDLAEADYISDKIEINKNMMQSPTIMKRITTPTNTLPSDTIIPASKTQNAFSSKSSYNLELIKHNQTRDTPGSISEQEMMKGFSTEELNQEMANLEGLMKNLSEITQNEFTC
ncbi:Neogenin -like protein [Schistosoma japonicum]|nr:Neogenin -like protein [Schistosoma japonicum]